MNSKLCWLNKQLLKISLQSQWMAFCLQCSHGEANWKFCDCLNNLSEKYNRLFLERIIRVHRTACLSYSEWHFSLTETKSRISCDCKVFFKILDLHFCFSISQGSTHCYVDHAKDRLEGRWGLSVVAKFRWISALTMHITLLSLWQGFASRGLQEWLLWAELSASPCQSTAAAPAGTCHC